MSPLDFNHQCSSRCILRGKLEFLGLLFLRCLTSVCCLIPSWFFPHFLVFLRLFILGSRCVLYHPENGNVGRRLERFSRGREETGKRTIVGNEVEKASVEALHSDVRDHCQGGLGYGHSLYVMFCLAKLGRSYEH